jgi:bifunctional enzyme CysN/CysC
MAHKSDLIAEDIHAYLKSHEHKGLLRFITCGSVDDGKSTLIGRLLYESKLIFEDQLAALEADSKKVGTQGGELDFALLVDGLAAEREQGITIDVAYRFFSTDRRKFIVADTPGHEQYTRNMVTGASTADVAVILVDARKGVLTQTRRHSYIVSLLGIRHIVLAINKMDLVEYSQQTFDEIVAGYREFAKQIGLTNIVAVPLSALRGDNMLERSARTPWYDGPTLMGYLESVEIEDDLQTKPFRLPVQWVNRPNQDFRGFAGTIASGKVRRGDTVRVLPSGRQSRVTRIVGFEADLEIAVAGQSVTLTLADEVDVSRGDLLAAADAPPAVADQFQATIIWMHEEPMLRGRPYAIKLGTRMLTGSITTPKHKVNVNTLERLAAKQLELNEIGVCNLSFDRAIPFDPYADNRETGGFILIDKLSNDTVGAGLLNFALRRAENIHWHTYTLDGDNVRHGLNRDLGFTDTDRVENIRRVAEVSRLMVDAGLIVLVSFISPFRSERRLARELMQPGEFLEVFVDTPLAEAEKRDVKGLYKKARRGELKNFTGLDSPYEPPEHPEIHLRTVLQSPEEAAEQILKTLRDGGMLYPADELSGL